MTAAPSDRELVVTRLINAPRALVFRAFTDPAQVVHWWGPFGFRNTSHEMRVQPGGVWRLTMHGPDGTDYPNESRYTAVVEGERLAFRHGTGAEDGPWFDTTITFTDEGGQTRVTLRQVYATAAEATVAKTFALEGGNQTLTRLEGYLAVSRALASPAVLEGVEPGTDDVDFLLTRTLQAPRDLVYRVMTEPLHLAKWFGPAGMELRVVSADVRPGGTLRYAMKAGPHEMFGRFVYRQLRPSDRMVNVVSFTDPEGTPVRHPMSATWPLEVLGLTSLTERAGQTVMYGRSIPIHATAEDRATFRAGHAGMVQGWKGTWDQLETYLSTLR